MNNGWESLDSEDDVVHFHQEQLGSLHNTQIVLQILNEIQSIWEQNHTNSGLSIFDKGLECYVLRPNQKWRTGKVKICLQFCPDEPEIEEQEDNNQLDDINQDNSPLDDLRQKFKNVET